MNTAVQGVLGPLQQRERMPLHPAWSLRLRAGGGALAHRRGRVGKGDSQAVLYGCDLARLHLQGDARDLAIAMNRLGGKSNTGEGGEESNRYTPDPNGDRLRVRLRRPGLKE